MEITKKFEKNSYSSKKALAEHFKIPKSTLRGNWEGIIVTNWDYGMYKVKRSWIQGKKHEEYEKVWLQWFKEKSALNIPVNMELLQEKVLYFSKKFNMNQISAYHGWIEKFKNWHELSKHVLSDENVNKGTV